MLNCDSINLTKQHLQFHDNLSVSLPPSVRLSVPVRTSVCISTMSKNVSHSST